MTHVDEHRLHADLAYRTAFLRDFIGFGPEDEGVIRTFRPLLQPLIGHFVAGMYHKLLDSDATRRYFLSRHSDYNGEVPPDEASLTGEHELVLFRKMRLSGYLERLLAGEWSGEDLAYLDQVGKMHTALAGAANLHVPAMYLSAMLGFLEDAILATLFRLHGVGSEEKMRAARAFNKLFWLQNDLMTRHHLPQLTAGAMAAGDHRG
jgi:hypothetical protein